MAHVFLDLDGTLSDPWEGITRSVMQALEQVGVTPPPAETLGWVIGPPLIESFAKLGVDDVEAALGHYRARYADVGLFENHVYDGIEAALAGMRDAGHVLCLVTAKPHVFARRITERFGLDAYLAEQFGPELDGTRNDKAELLAHALAVTGAEAARSVMVGDRHHDFDAARANGVKALAVRWGYGAPEEWAQADAICDAPGELCAAIGALLDR
ncbi:HAD hydrolase-like protein [Rhodalgimonas zhirmunskyi]|uniref:HAD hydrolase-like protein n=1 Tax=Rhodalgimonas zhirmunskyi TaxID=2964767 RepID=A0AAJ1X6N6_9RHOB|nr:HAD hydrolase-like protein [Rhodoalgimonas zhirmunskyi]MDQ2094884.1 HAD hydrolase-like protein [Rhodoalgimonas zhirmunskyi]